MGSEHLVTIAGKCKFRNQFQHKLCDLDNFMTADASLVALIVRHGAGWNGNDFLSRNITIFDNICQYFRTRNKNDCENLSINDASIAELGALAHCPQRCSVNLDLQNAKQKFI